MLYFALKYFCSIALLFKQNGRRITSLPLLKDKKIIKEFFFPPFFERSINLIHLSRRSMCTIHLRLICEEFSWAREEKWRSSKSITWNGSLVSRIGTGGVQHKHSRTWEDFICSECSNWKRQHTYMRSRDSIWDFFRVLTRALYYFLDLKKVSLCYLFCLISVKWPESIYQDHGRK